MVQKPPKDQKDNPLRERIKIPVSERIEAVNAMLCSGEDPPRVRIKINERCENLIKSLSGLEFTDDGKNINKQVDKKAGRASNKDRAMLMTHPTDALGYYIYKRFPVLRKRQGVMFFQIPGESITEYRNGVKTTKTETSVPDFVKEKREDRRLRREERRKKREAKQNSIKSWMDYGNLWGGQGGTLF